jgi:AraC family transcriptional regulator
MQSIPTAEPAVAPCALPAPALAAAIGRYAACRAMSVEWRPLRAGEEIAVESEDIAVAVPFEGATCRTLLSDGSGRVHEAPLADPAVAVLPPQVARSLVAEHGGSCLLVRLPASHWYEKTRAALGHAREIRESFLGADDFVRGVASFLSERLRSGGAPSEWLESVGDDIGVHLATRYGRPADAASCAGLAPHRLQRVLALIEERLAEPIQVRELAGAVHMSPYHFARMFKQSTGQPPHLYITWLRMDRAKQLLAQTALPLAEIATRVGYQTQAHFTGVFHARVGTTPRAYRLRVRNERSPGESERADQPSR